MDDSTLFFKNTTIRQPPYEAGGVTSESWRNVASESLPRCGTYPRKAAAPPGHGRRPWVLADRKVNRLTVVTRAQKLPKRHGGPAVL
jgi:hypothetical protein